jgi:hypothetical protein
VEGTAVGKFENLMCRQAGMVEIDLKTLFEKLDA